MKIQSKAVSFTLENKAEVMKYIEEILDTGALTLGKYTSLLEEEVRNILGVRYVVAVNSGTSALEMILRALDIAGKKVLVPTNTFAATIFAVVHAGGIPVFVDNEPGKSFAGVNQYLDVLDAETAAIVAVHIGGEINPAFPELVELCNERGLPLIEDAAHALGSRLGNVSAGTFGVAAAFSLYPTKVVTSGEGGLIVTNDEAIYRQMLILRDQGKANFWNNYSVALGYNWRLSELNAALGYVHVKSLPEICTHRNRIADLYHEKLAGLTGVKTPTIATGDYCNYYKYVVQLADQYDLDQLKQTAKAEYGFNFSGEVYKVPCHQQPAFKAYLSGRAMPNAEFFCNHHLALPMYNSLTLAEAAYIAEACVALIKKADDGCAV